MPAVASPEYVALDLETTGLDPRTDRVIEVGAVVFRGDEVLERLDRLVNPGRHVPAPVLRLTGIDPIQLRSGATQQSALVALADMIGGRQPVGHGTELDVAFLRMAGLWREDWQMLDTLLLARILLPLSPSHSLPALSVELGLDQPRPHRALDDADAARQLLLHLRVLAIGLDEPLKEAMIALVAPYQWPLASFFAEALTAPTRGAVEHKVETTTVVASTGHRPPPDWDLDALVELVGPGGALSRAMPDHEVREAQAQMLRAVGQTMERGRRLVVEAGTGTGKSLAYLLPALGRVAAGERTIVSTATHTLQEQLMAKDLPFLREWLPWDFEARLLKGRTNYISLRQWRRYLAEACSDHEELAFKLKVLSWLQRTETGDRAELRLHGRDEVFWTRIASDSVDCLGVHCTSEDCYVHRARALAQEADVVVINHALLLADAQQGGGILPEFDHLVIDEAHHLEDAATSGLRRDLDGAGLLALLERLASPDQDGTAGGLLPAMVSQPRLGATDDIADAVPLVVQSTAAVRTAFGSLAGFLTRLKPDVARRDETVRLVPGLAEEPGWQELCDRMADAATLLSAVDARLRRAVTAGRDWLGGEEPDPQLREMELVRERIAEAGTLLAEAFSAPDPGSVYWVVLLARTNEVVVRAAPVDVGELLRESVYQPRRSVTLTSASLVVGGGFEYFRGRAGLGSDVEELELASPFDYLSQALVCLPQGMPDPNHAQFAPLVSSVLGDVASRIGGRTLALFTSHQQLRDTYHDLKTRHDLDRVMILGQGIDGDRRAVLKSFMEQENGLLLGAASFWEGIDIPGDRLSCVVVVRLPFAVPTDPVFAARAERVPDSFSGYAVPQAALRLKQGFGRLIRRGTDRGAVVILDGRVSSRDYGRVFLEALPLAARFSGPTHEVAGRIAQWLDGQTAMTTR